MNRNPKTNRYKMVGSWNGLDRRENTSECQPPSDVSFLHNELFEAIKKEMIIIGPGTAPDV